MAEQVDVLIIGAGASGAAVAWSLAETRMRIVCLEQGEWPNPANFPSTGRDWESRAFSDFSMNPNVRMGIGDYPINDSDSPIKIANFNGVGGGTVLYAAHFPRLHPSDFRVRTLDGVAADWPVDYEMLEPYYAENDRIMGVAGLAGDPAYPPKSPPLPPVPLGKTGQTIGRGFNALGWHWWPSDAAIATREYAGRAACINIGNCVAGCAQGAKASTDITYWPLAMRQRVEVRTRCRVRAIETNEKGMASGVHYFDSEGNEHFLAAEIVILACNGIGTPRILLNSASPRFPNGLANSTGLVGKNLMFHPDARVQAAFDEPLDGYRGPHISIWSQEFYETDQSRGFVRGYTFQINRGLGPVATSLFGLLSGAIPWGPGHHDAFHRYFNRTADILAICEDLPEETNQVTIDPELKDANGIPAPRVHYRMGENTERMIKHAIERATEAARAAGAIEVRSEYPWELGGWHLMGTARMGREPKRSVVNEWGRCHDVKNLFIVDGSIFVTAGAVNPTCTIQALALYIADNIKKRLANLFD